MRFKSFAIGLALATATAAQPAWAAITYSIVDLGTLGGTTPRAFGFREANGINEAGQVTGRADTAGNSGNPSGPPHAFLYSNGTMMDLGAFAGNVSFGYGINDAGDVTGSSLMTPGGRDEVAFIYRNGMMDSLGTLGGDRSIGYGINDALQVTGTSENSDGLQRGFIYENGVMYEITTTLGIVTGGRAINASGQVTGTFFRPGGFETAFLYSNGTLIDLGTLGGRFSEGLGINDAGQVTGFANTASGNSHAFLYANGAMTDLGTLGGARSRGYAINSLGQIVGGSETAQSILNDAFLYDNGTMLNLNDLIDPQSGWSLSFATGINDRGQIIGVGARGGDGRIFLLTPLGDGGAVPEPATWATMIAGFGLVGGAVRRRRAGVAIAA